MTSNKENPAPHPEDDPELKYGPEAVDLVVGGYKRIVGLVDEAKSRGLFPDGWLLTEVLPKLPDTAQLLTVDELYKFKNYTLLFDTDEILRLIWYILENKCEEKSLGPAIKLDRKHGHAFVYLSK